MKKKPFLIQHFHFQLDLKNDFSHSVYKFLFMSHMCIHVRVRPRARTHSVTQHVRDDVTAARAR